MATWEDGPEYAPALRPDHFAEPPVAPLSIASPSRPPALNAPVERPGFDHPPVPVAPLAALVPPVGEARDPSMPFQVASAAVTEASSAWSAAHWSQPAGPPLSITEPLAPGSATPGALGPAPDHAFAPGPQPSNPYPAPFPAPGTAQWFQPAPPYPPPPVAPRGGPGAIAQALTLGVIICLGIGGFVWPLSPVAVLVAFGLATRVKAGRTVVLGLFTAVVSILVVVGVIGALLSDDFFYFFSDWWELVARWGQVLCWALLVAAWIAVWRALRGMPGDKPGGYGPTPTVWG